MKSEEEIVSTFLILAIGFGLPLCFCAEELYMLKRQQYPHNDTQADSNLLLENSSMDSVGCPQIFFFLRNYGRKLNKGSHLHRTQRSPTLPQPSYVIALSLLNPVFQSYQGTSLLPKYSRDVVIMPWALIAKTGTPVSLGVCEVKYIQEHELDSS